MISSQIKHIFFDLDHTLWDYERNSAEALRILYEKFGLQNLGLHPVEDFIESFRKANLTVWDLFDESAVNQAQLRHKRLELVFESFGLEPIVVEGFHENYFKHCSSGTNLIEGAIETLRALKTKYQLHIITNGFEDSQHIKLKNTGLKPYFKTVTTSEIAKSKKPDSAYFEFALDQAGAQKHESLIIGDGLRTDVAGALNFGLDVIWFNPEEKKATYENLKEVKLLKDIIPA